jgi:hypothetical protein
MAERDWFSEINGMDMQGQNQPQQEPSRDWFTEINSVTAAAPKAQPAPAPQTQSPSMFERVRSAVQGPQDPNEANTGTVFEQYRDDLTSPTASAAMMGASDAQMADVITKQLGDRVLRQEKDANGYPVLVTKGPDGQPQRGYVNKPGLDTQDAWRALYGAAPYVVGGAATGVALKAAPAVVNALGQGAVAGATSVAGDVGLSGMGSEQGVDIPKAAITAGVGAAAPAVASAASALWKRFVVQPSLYDSATGQLTAKGAEAAKRQGIDPGELSNEIAKNFAKTYSKTGDEAAAGLAARRDEFGIPSTVGQRTKDAEKLTGEESMRRGLYGQKAKETITGFDRQQSEAVDFAARSKVPSTFRASEVQRGGTMAPNGSVADMGRMSAVPDLGDGIRSGLRAAKDAAKAQEGAAWGNVKDIIAKPEAFQLLPQKLTEALGDFRIDTVAGPGNTNPIALNMIKQLDDFATGKQITAEGPSILQQAPIKTVDQMRRSLGAQVNSAGTDADRNASKAVYRAYNDWIKDSAERELLAGDPMAAANLRSAIDISRVKNQIFRPQDKGRPTAAGKIIDDVIDKADTPERVVAALFQGVPKSLPKPGSADALRLMRRGLDGYADKRVAADTWADIKTAYWSRIVQNAKGDVETPGVMLNNLKTALNSQRSVINELFTKPEIDQMLRFQKELARISYKPPNASGSGYTVGSLAKQFFGTIFQGTGLRGKVASALLEKYGPGEAIGNASARAAIDETIRAPRGNALAPMITGAGSEFGRQKTQ